MKLSKMPKKLKIGGRKYDIIYPHLFTSDPRLLGLHEADQQNIKLSKLFLGQQRHWNKICETLLHETMHAVDHIYCHGVMQENEVYVMSNWMYQVIRDNNLNIKANILPKSVKIGGFVYKVQFPYVYNEGEESLCTIEHERAEIRISASNSASGPYGEAVIMANLIYLITCAICEMSTMPRGFTHGNKLEELGFQNSFANGLHQVFMDNDLETLLKSDGEKK
ncbi:MAG: hypothetical protein ACFFCQ_08520 [Promethearchaeota archaeon]